ncbi:MAG: hypothetical protein Q7S68_00995, partial [Deltaproteobacteria bacterium]|nr:hypothetical protein [Deltaproteobacteria bacterium]
LLRENSPLFGRAKFLAKEAEQTCWSSNCEIKKSSARREFIDLNWVMVSELNDSKKKEIFAEGVALLMDDAVDPQAIPFYRSLIKNLDLFSEEEAGVLRGKLLEFVKSKGGHDSKDKDIRRLTYELVGIDPTNITVLGLGHDEDPWRQFTGLEQRKWLIKKLPEEEPTVKIEAEIASLEAMAKKYPQEPFYPFAIGFYYSDMQLNTKGDDSLADAYYKIAVALAPEVEVYLSFLSVDTDEEKRAKYEKLAQMDPTNADYYYQYQLWSNADDDRQKVYEAAQKAFELDPTNGYHWAHYLVAQVRMDLIEEAQKTAGQLDRIAPKSFADVMSFPFRSDLFPPTVRRIVLEEFIRHNPYRNTDKLQKELETIEAELAGVTTEKKAEPKAEPAPAQQSAPVAEKAQETSAPTDATDPVLQLVRKGYEQLQAGQTPASYKSFREAIKEGRRETKAKAQIGLLLAYRQGGNWGEFHKLGRDPKNDATVTSFYEQLRDRKITDQQIADMIQSRD